MNDTSFRYDAQARPPAKHLLRSELSSSRDLENGFPSVSIGEARVRATRRGAALGLLKKGGKHGRKRWNGGGRRGTDGRGRGETVPRAGQRTRAYRGRDARHAHRGRRRGGV